MFRDFPLRKVGDAVPNLNPRRTFLGCQVDETDVAAGPKVPIINAK